MNLPDHDAEQLDAFVQQLAHDPNTPAPASLDPGFAEFVRLVVISEQGASLAPAVQARIWNHVRGNHRARLLPQPSANGRHPPLSATEILYRRKTTEPQPIPRPGGILTALAAALILVALGAWLLFAQSHAQIGTGEPTPQKLSTTAVATAPATESPSAGVTAPPQPSGYVAWSPLGDRIASVGGTREDEISLWDRDGHLMKSLKGHSGPITGLAWSPDGKGLASGGNDSSVRLWTSSGDSVAILSDHTGRVDSLMWSPDSSMLASAASNGDGTIRLWTAQGQPVLTIKGATSATGGGTRITWSPDGKRLLAYYGDDTADIWALDGTMVASIGGASSIGDVAWAPDSSRVAAATMDHGIEIYTVDGKLDTTLPDPVGTTRLCWSPDGRFIAARTMGNAVQLYDTQYRRLRASIDDPGGAVADMAFSPDSRLLATASLNPSAFVKLWNLQGEALASYSANQPNTTETAALSWSPDGKVIAAWMQGLSALRLVMLDETVLARAVNAASAGPTLPTAASVMANGTASSDGLTEVPAELPLPIGQTVSGEITKPGKGIRYVVKTPDTGKLLVLLQSDDFFVGVTQQQVMCTDSIGNGGGGGGGGSSDAKGGSPEIRPFIVETCPGQVNLVVDSVSGTETGRFTLAVYKLAPTDITMDEPVQGTIGADTPFKSYTFAGTAGNILTVELDSPDKTPFHLIVGGSIFVGTNSAGDTSQYILSDGNYDLLIVPARKVTSGRLGLTLRQDRPPTLDSKIQTVQFDSEHHAAAFLVKGSDKALALKVHMTSGTGDIQIALVPALLSNPAQSTGNTNQQATHFTVAPNVPSVFKLTTRPDQDNVLILSPTTDGITKIELSVSAP